MDEISVIFANICKFWITNSYVVEQIVFKKKISVKY